ncbi:MAG: VCBS repeat-containing protein [bacterium]|nr:VCBS repeat-containing protein [bacterium]
MRLSVARMMAFIVVAVSVVVGCQSLYDSGSGTNISGPGALPDSSDSASDQFSSATGFFPADSHDVPDGTPVVIFEESSEEGEETASNFRAIQIDPLLESTAGPKFVMPFDIDNDGLIDLLTGWNENQPVQIHLQRRNEDGDISYVAVNLGGTGPIGIIGDLDMIDFDGDGWLDVAVLVKETGQVGVCPIEGGWDALDDAGTGEVQILFNPGNLDQITDGDAWREVRLERSQLPVRRDVSVEDSQTYPEFNGYTGMAVGEIDGINGPDVIVAYNPAKCTFYGDDPSPVNRIVLYANPGGANMFAGGSLPLSVTAQATGPDQANTNGEATLDSSTSFSRQGFAPLGPGFGGVNYSWTQAAGPAVTLVGTATAAPTFVAPATPTALTFRLDVNFGGQTDFDYVTVHIAEFGSAPPNYGPTVVASGEQTVVPNVKSPGSITVTMTASGSDPDGDALAYTWTQVRGESVNLNGANTPTATFNPPVTGDELRFRVTVSDGTLLDTDLVIINSGFWAPVVLEGDLPRVSDVKPSDVDLDGDLDVIWTYPDALTSNIEWGRNPSNIVGAKDTLIPANWELRPVGHVVKWADVVTIGDVDMDGFDDVLTRSHEGQVVQWFRHPGAADREPIFPPPDVVPDRFNFPWQVYTLAEYPIGRLAGMAIGDLTGNGVNEIAISAGGIVYWYDATISESTYGPWVQNFVLDDTKAQGTTDDTDDLDFEDSGTVIYWLNIIDIDGDGYGDILGTMDRRVDSGLMDDTLVWFRNTLGDGDATTEE